MDAFAQQLIHATSVRTVANNATQEAAVQVQWLYDDGRDGWCFNESAVYNAFTGVTDARCLDTTHICTTGNCSWTPYETLAFCDTCADITSHVQMSDGCFKNRDEMCELYIPSGPSLEFSLYNWYPQGHTNDWWYNTTILSSKGGGPLLHITDVGLPLLNFTRLNFWLSSESVLRDLIEDCGFDKLTGDPAQKSKCVNKFLNITRATECALYWCVHRYSAISESTKFTETLLKAWSSASPTYPGLEGLTYNVTPEQNDLSPHDHASVFFVDGYSQVDLSRALKPMFDASVYYYDLFIAQQQSTVASRLASQTFGSPPTLLKYEELANDTLAIGFSNMSFSLTQSLRQTAKGNEYISCGDTVIPAFDYNHVGNDTGNIRINGTSYENATVIQVRWGWLVYPTYLLFMTIILTISTKIRTSRQRIPQWRSSIIPLMVHGPYSISAEPSHSSSTTDQMDRLAKRTLVSLSPTRAGWKLSERGTTQDDGSKGVQLSRKPRRPVGPSTHLKAQQPPIASQTDASGGFCRGRAREYPPINTSAIRSRSI